MITIETAEEYQAARERLKELRERFLADRPETAEVAALMAAIENWEELNNPLRKEKPGKFAT